MADSYDIDVLQGTTLDLNLTLKDASGIAINLSGYSVIGEVKWRYGETGILVNLNPTILSAASGQISIILPASGTTTYPVGIFNYNIFIRSGVLNTNILNGHFNVTPTVYGDI